ncbi:acetyl-CoA C-acetyltransferase [Cnuibacter physcomitrellae]|uniref:acetyl-CoA C-acetyltransferase n=1 Tax=Cnuibacter physcomitrellae TaxID=1619308 RepID=UPI0021761332|nr:acetyl-CoA C-acetyltransferase [Cnuibacter physcomitrellae]MCS5498329.1 acetyl-CoA C-acetyltransferase [Cnuibacter physcomitrellae]
MPEAVIVSAARSPIGRAFRGSLAGERAEDLAAAMVRSALAAVPELDVAEVDDLILGCGLPGALQGRNLARIVAVLLGHDGLPGTTVTRYCASSVQSTRMALHAIRAGEGTAFISAGVESVSGQRTASADLVPGMALEHPRFAEAMRRTEEAVEAGAGSWEDPRASGSLPDAYIAMGQTAENVARLRGISREEQDEWAELSQRRAREAADRGHWSREITPYETADGARIEADDSPRPGTTLEGLAGLTPVFRPDGTVTAGNSCPLNDGAAALVVMSDERAAALGLTPWARIVSTGVSALSPEIMGLGPVEASRRALANAGLATGDIDLWEINEAFAVQVIASMRDLDLSADVLNVNGGAIAVGHPFGMTGARMITSLLNNLRDRDRTLGLVSMCVAGGQGMGIVLERLR